jgi:hypothetical protein
VLEPVAVREPDAAAVLEHLRRVEDRYAKHHGVRYDDDALRRIVEIAEEARGGRTLGEVALDLLDEAGARTWTARRGAKQDPPRVDVAAVEGVAAATLGRAPGPAGTPTPAVRPPAPHPLDEVRRGTAFVLLPRPAEFRDVYDEAIAPPLRDLGLRPAAPEDLLPPPEHRDRVARGVRTAEVVVADVTGFEPGVMYGLGFAHGAGRSVLLLHRGAADLPADLRSLPCLRYEEGKDGLRALRANLSWSVREALRAGG